MEIEAWQYQVSEIINAQMLAAEAPRHPWRSHFNIIRKLRPIEFPKYFHTLEIILKSGYREVETLGQSVAYTACPNLQICR